MGRPRLIILIRHAQSEGNKNRDIHQTVPDHRVKLTAEGQKQATEAGRKLRALLRPDDTLHFFTSPYRRTRETTEGILASLTSDSPTPSPFPRHTIKVYEEPRLREQDFGNFQPCSAEMTRMWQERADYGHFFYRIPNGESAADAYDRVSGFNESLWRSFGEDDFASVSVLVTHGLMTRVFLMKWYHWSVEYFEDLRNINHCEFIVMKQNSDNGKYILQNNLRTWTEYRKERADAEAKEEAEASALRSSPIPVRKRWGGCPDGCDHSAHQVVKRPPRRQNTADLFRDAGTSSLQHQESAMKKKGAGRTQVEFVGEDEEDPKGRIGEPKEETPTTEADPSLGKLGKLSLLVERKKVANKDPIISPNRLAVLQAGRDGGGSRSGDASEAGSSDEDKDFDSKRKMTTMASSMTMALNGAFDGDGVFRTGTMADALGDQSDMDDDEEVDGTDDLKRAEAEDRSFEGSVR